MTFDATEAAKLITVEVKPSRRPSGGEAVANPSRVRLCCVKYIGTLIRTLTKKETRESFTAAATQL